MTVFVSCLECQVDWRIKLLISSALSCLCLLSYHLMDVPFAVFFFFSQFFPIFFILSVFFPSILLVLFPFLSHFVCAWIKILFFPSRSDHVICKSTASWWSQLPSVCQIQEMGGTCRKITLNPVDSVTSYYTNHLGSFTSNLQQSEKVLSFVPPDGSYRLLSYHITTG